MSFPHQRRNWKRFQPRDLREALRGCKDYARERKRLSVERIADLMGVSADCLYKWLADARMPLASVQLYEHICGAHFVTDYLAGGAGRMVVPIPTGVPVGVEDLAELQAQLADVLARLARCYRSGEDAPGTHEGLSCSLQSLAWHRENVSHMEQPELDLAGGEDV